MLYIKYVHIITHNQINYLALDNVDLPCREVHTIYEREIFLRKRYSVVESSSTVCRWWLLGHYGQVVA